MGNDILIFLPPLKAVNTHNYQTETRGVAQSGSVSAWGAGGRWFESSHPD